MSNFKETLKNAWQKVCSFLNNEEHKRSVFYLSDEERKKLNEDYTLTQQFIYPVGRYPAYTMSIPTQTFKVQHLDGRALSEDEISALEQRLSDMRHTPKNDDNQPKL